MTSFHSTIYKADDVDFNVILHLSNVQLFLMVILHLKQASLCDKS